MSPVPLRRILLVEDNPGDALLLRVMLEDSHLGGVVLDTAGTLAEAVDRLGGEKPLILLDLTLPDSWGPQTYLAMREAALDSPIVILSGLSDEGVALELVREGAQDYLVKGQFDQEVLVRAIRYAWERQRIEKELVRRQVWWEAVIQAIPDAVVIADRDQRVVVVNEAAEVLWGQPATSLLASNLLELFPDDGLTKERLLHFLCFDGAEERHAGGVPLQTNVVHLDGRMVPCELHHSCFSVGGDDLDVLVVRDLSERRRLEQQLAQTQKLDAIGHLSAGVAHDFNNLLGVIAGNLDLLGLKLEQPPLRKRLETALEATRRGADLTRQLLSFSRSSDLRPQAVALGPLLHNFLKMAGRTVGPDIDIELAVRPDLPEVVVDPSELERALLNLTVNARDAMPGGGRLVFSTEVQHVEPQDLLAVVDSLPPGPYVVLAVSDSGEGIPSTILQKVFEPFFTTKEKGKGTGLGLAMVYGFCKQSGGAVRLTSEVGHGTVVRLFLPVGEGRPRVPDVSRARVYSPPPGSRALVVDDEPALLEVSSRYLVELGYDVMSAPDGPSALALVHAGQPFSLLLTDVLMPGGMNGQQLATAVRQSLPSIKVLFTSGFPAQSFADKNLLLDSVMLPKPFVGNDLMRALASLDEA